MTKEFYEAPSMELLQMQSENCILEDSKTGLEDYNNVDWEW